MCRIKFEETFRMNVGVSDLSKKSHSRKTVFFKNLKPLGPLKFLYYSIVLFASTIHI